jgi:cytochrome c oxidase subunit 2
MFPTLLAQRSFWLETPASTSAVAHDFAFYALLYVMGFFFFLVTAVMLAFVVKYRRRKGVPTDGTPMHNTALEVFWTIVPLIIVTGFFVLGLYGFVDLETPPAGADVVDVEASQWHFNFKYPNGAESDELYLRLNRPVLLRLTSKDVSHALYVPAFRVQRNAVPGRTTYLWFQPTELTAGKDPETGEDAYFHAFCTQYCGDGHSEMHAKVFVLEPADYDKRLSDAANIFVDHATNKPLAFVDVGKKLYAGNCAQCHTIDGGAGQGPTWKGLYKSDVKFASSNVPGFTLAENDDNEKWDAYLVESILHPEAKIVQGFQNVMPSQESSFSDAAGSVPKLSDIVARIEAGKDTSYKEKKLAAITEFIKSVGNPKYYKPMKAPPPAPAAATQPGDAAKPHAPAKESKPDSPASGNKPEAPAKGRPADEPNDKSKTPTP